MSKENFYDVIREVKAIIEEHKQERKAFYESLKKQADQEWEELMDQLFPEPRQNSGSESLLGSEHNEGDTAQNTQGQYIHVTEEEASDIEVAEETHVNEDHIYCDYEMGDSLDEPVSSLVINNELSVQIKKLENCQSNNLFQTKAEVQDEEYIFIMDGGSCHNLASNEMSETLGLKLFQNPHPYQQMSDELPAQHNGKTNHYFVKWKEKDSVQHKEVSPIFNDSDLSPYWGDKDESESRTTLFEEGEDDEDILPHKVDHFHKEIYKGPVTRSQAKQLQNEVNSFITSTSFNKNSMLPNSCVFLLLRNINMDQRVTKKAQPKYGVQFVMDQSVTKKAQPKYGVQFFKENVTYLAKEPSIKGLDYGALMAKENVTHEGSKEAEKRDKKQSIKMESKAINGARISAPDG